MFGFIMKMLIGLLNLRTIERFYQSFQQFSVISP